MYRCIMSVSTCHRNKCTKPKIDEWLDTTKSFGTYISMKTKQNDLLKKIEEKKASPIL